MDTMTQPVSRNFTSVHDNQTHPEDYEPTARPAASSAKTAGSGTPAGQTKSAGPGPKHLVATKQPSRAAQFVAARRPPIQEAGAVSDAAKTFGRKALGPLETPLDVAAYCARNATACMAVGAGYLLYEAVFGAEAGPLPPPPGGSCQPEPPPTTPEPTASSDPCARESSLACLPPAYRDGIHE